jgi:hypothetical protein
MLIKASELKNSQKRISTSFRKKVNEFLSGRIADQIRITNQLGYTSINFKLPCWAVDQDKDFYEIAIFKLESLGYKAKRSQDDAYIYDTLFISWK